MPNEYAGPTLTPWPFAQAGPLELPTWQQMLTWLLFLPLICLIAGQMPYFSGPPRDAAVYEMGAAAGPGVDYHATLYLGMALEAVFAATALRSIGTVLKRNLLIPVGVGLVFLSSLWSASPGYPLRLGLQLMLATLFACYLSVRMSADRLMRLMMFLGAATALLSILFALALPSYGIFAGYDGNAWNGICNHKNTLGLAMAYLLAPAFFVESCSRTRRALYIALLTGVLVMSQSRGGWVCGAGVFLFAAFLTSLQRLRQREALAFMLTAAIAIAVVAVAAVQWFGVIAPMLGKTTSMSGRTDIYREVWHSVLKAPLLGYGYGSFWHITPEAARIGIAVGWTNIGYSESGVLELALQLGFVGVALVMVMLGRAALQGFRLLRTNFYTPRVGWYLTILVLAVLSDIDTGRLLFPSTIDWCMVLIACIGLDAETRHAVYAPHRQFYRNPRTAQVAAGVSA
jgi:exopolysaccharide production protein ExoQ